MNRTATHLTRILALIPWVIAHPGSSVAEVCSRFGYASSRDLIRDLDLVFVCGLPGYGPGDLMVAYVEEDEVVVDMADYFAAAPNLTAAESLALLAAGMTVLASGQGSDPLGSAVEKLGRALLPDADEMLIVDMDAEPELAATLRTAASEGRVVEIEYTGLARGEHTVRSIEPWIVYASMGNWYVSAYCRRAVGDRVFRLDRIRRATVTDESFAVPDPRPAPPDGYVATEDDVVATIELHRGAHWVPEYYRVEEVERDGDRRVVRFSTYEPMVAAQLLLRLGPTATLLEGEEARAALGELRKDLLARYGV
ncbi:MAG TPA: WYL domain-containing protein [Acidimicrobiia bacterium]|nr:WYL domain-containing protein [Acidimicrobiia bacterium]